MLINNTQDPARSDARARCSHGGYEFLLAGDVFSVDQIESYIELKWNEVYKFEHTPHPVEFEMYYSV